MVQFDYCGNVKLASEETEEAPVFSKSTGKPIYAGNPEDRAVNSTKKETDGFPSPKSLATPKKRTRYTAIADDSDVDC